MSVISTPSEKLKSTRLVDAVYHKMANQFSIWRGQRLRQGAFNRHIPSRLRHGGYKRQVGMAWYQLYVAIQKLEARLAIETLRQRIK